MFADYHVHSHFSEDTDFPMELEIQKAIKLGMDELCFTEHSDYDVPTVVNCDYDAYFEEMEKMKDKYKGQITLKTGIEFGIQTHTTKAYEESPSCRTSRAQTSAFSSPRLNHTGRTWVGSAALRRKGSSPLSTRDEPSARPAQISSFALQMFS